MSGQPRNSAVSLAAVGAPTAYWDGSTPIASAAATSAPVRVQDLDAYAVQISTPAASTLAGSFALQGSNDFNPADLSAAVSPPNWTTLSFWDAGAGAYATSKAIVSGAQSVMLAERGCTYRWLQLVFSGGTGSGNPTIRFQAKGCQ